TPTNRPHVSYIEDLLFHGLLDEYAAFNPNHVKFDVVNDLKNYDEIKDIQDRKKARTAFQYLDSKGLVRPLQEACETLARPTQGSKDKEEEQKQEQEAYKSEDRDNDQDQNQTRNVLDGTGFYERLKSEVGGLALIGSGDLTFSKDVDQILEMLQGADIKNPKEYLFNNIKKTDWLTTEWPQYRDKLLEGEEVPF